MGKAVRPGSLCCRCPLTPWQKLIAASDPGDAYTTFTGVTLLKQGISPSGVFIDGPDTGMNRSGSLNRAVTAPPTVSLMPSALSCTVIASVFF